MHIDIDLMTREVEVERADGMTSRRQILWEAERDGFQDPRIKDGALIDKEEEIMAVCARPLGSDQRFEAEIALDMRELKKFIVGKERHRAMAHAERRGKRTDLAPLVAIDEMHIGPGH